MIIRSTHHVEIDFSYILYDFLEGLITEFLAIMKYNPNLHHRRSLRLKGYDYSKSALYFITICCYKRECFFGEILKTGKEQIMSLSQSGFVVQNC